MCFPIVCRICLLSVLGVFLVGCSSGTPGSFTLVVTPSSLTLQAGSSAPISVSAVATGNFTTPVSVALTNLPAGVTASPQTLTLTPGTAQTFTLTASVNTTVGTSSLGLTATGGTLTQKATVALTTTLPPSFTLSITHPSSNVPIGGPGLPLTYHREPERSGHRRRRSAAAHDP